MMIFKHILFLLRDALVLSMNSISGSFPQTEDSDIKIIIQYLFHHSIRPGSSNMAIGISSFFQFPFSADHGWRRHALLCKICRYFPITAALNIQIINQSDIFCFLLHDFKGFLLLSSSSISKWGLCDQCSFLLLRT